MTILSQMEVGNKNVPITANHMVLTKHGWGKLNSLQTGVFIMTDKGFQKITKIHHYKPKKEG